MVTIFSAPTYYTVAFPSTTSYAMNKSLHHTTVKRHALPLLNNSGTGTVEVSSLPAERQKSKQGMALPPLAMIKQLLISNMLLLNKITKVSAATMQRWEVDSGKAARQVDDLIAEAPASYERLLEAGLVFQQNFTIRSFEIGSDFKISIEGLMNYLQETALNHLKSVGILADGFGSTPRMITRDLVWVLCWSHMEVDHYPSWADVVQVDAWMYRSGKNAISRDWNIRDSKTGRTLIRATGLYVMMNKKTRRFAKLSEEVIADLKPFFMQCDPLIHKDSKKLQHLEPHQADYVRTGLTPGWTDMDVNKHVSHIKLVNYVLESVPRSVVESHELSALTLEYRKECIGDSVLQSLSKVVSDRLSYNKEIEFDHLLGFEDGPEIVRGRTKWRPKCSNQI